MKTRPFDLMLAQREFVRSIQMSPHAARLMKVFCRKIGPRVPGTRAMERAHELLRKEWSAFGAAPIQREPVLLSSWKEGATRVELIAPSRKSFDAIQAIHSAPGVVEGPLQDGGTLDFADLHRLDDRARGSILIVSGHQIAGGLYEAVQKRVSLAEALGAVAVILVDRDPKLPSIQYLNGTHVPVVSLSMGAGKILRQTLRKRPARMRIRAEGQSRRVICHNLVGELGPRHAREIVGACAHLDCFYLSPAAIDNLSGVVTMTEAARALAPYQEHFVRKLRFIAFTGEEYGFAGSKQYVRAHRDELDRFRFVLSMDCMFESTAKGFAVIWEPRLRPYIDSSVRHLRPRIDVRDRFCMSSDYLPFMLAGVPAGKPTDWHNSFPPLTHTVKDTEEGVPTSWLTANAKMCASILLRMLTDPRPLPGRRKSAREVQELVQREDAADPLRWQVLLPS
jgi:hypothetical protein